MKILLTAALLVGVPATAIAAQPASQSALEEAARKAAAATAEKRGDNAYICKKLPPPPGTRLGGGRQICKTQQEWDLHDEDIRTAMSEADRKSTQQR